MNIRELNDIFLPFPMKELDSLRVESEQQPKFLALLFPGQGLSPKDIRENFQQLRNINPDLVMRRFESAQQAVGEINSAAGFDLLSSLGNEDSPCFDKTSFVQPVVYVLSVLSYEIYQTKTNHRKVNPQYVAGHSLGEYTALTAASVTTFEDGIKIVTARGKFMQEACERTKSELVSIHGLEKEGVESVCRETGTTIALINAPNLIVIGTAEGQFEHIQTMAKERGAKRVAKLQTAGAFHSPHMQEAADKLDRFLEGFTLNDPQIPVIPNLTGQPSKSGNALRQHLVESMVMPVKWADTIGYMRTTGINCFIELGLGNSLTALNKVNNVPDGQTKNLDSVLL